jgi:hypothetical protein
VTNTPAGIPSCRKFELCAVYVRVHRVFHTITLVGQPPQRLTNLNSQAAGRLTYPPNASAGIPSCRKSKHSIPKFSCPAGVPLYSPFYNWTPVKKPRHRKPHPNQNPSSQAPPKPKPIIASPT